MGLRKQIALVLAAFGASAQASSVVAQLKDSFGAYEARVIEERATVLEEAIRPIFASMPHNEQGKMGTSVTRYVLHRLFMQKGWSVRGLDPAGQAWTEGSPAEMLGHAHLSLKQHFDQLLKTEGLDLQEVSLLASAFKSVVRAEMNLRLMAAVRANGEGSAESIGEEKAEDILDTYLASHIVGVNITGMDDWEVHQVERRAAQEYAGWGQLQDLARNIRGQVVAGHSTTSLGDLKTVIEQVGEEFGPSENSECQMRKKELLTLEDKGTGRVRLADFYKANLHEGKWHFGESSGYLRQLGALDDSDADDLKVIIPNYVNSKSNCIDPSKYYSVCCLNECDVLLGEIEAKLGAPLAAPEEIASLVAAMPSATVQGNRTLAPSLLKRLQEVADENNGRVPLHGRLFSQWLHHAYPRECPFPHVAGTTSPLRVQDWAAAPGNEVVARREEMLQHIETPRKADEEDDDGECAPWMGDEELIAPHAHMRATPAAQGGLFSLKRIVLLIIGAGALFAAMGSGAVTVRPVAARDDKTEKGFVHFV